MIYFARPSKRCLLTLLCGRSCSGVAKGAGVGLSLYVGEMENTGSLAARGDLESLRRVVVTCSETVLSPGVTVFLILQNLILYFWRK